MIWIGLLYLIELVALIVLIWIGWRFFDKRYRGNRTSGHTGMYDGSMERTAEVFIDPKDGKTYRVYYNRKTGEREYVEEK